MNKSAAKTKTTGCDAGAVAFAPQATSLLMATADAFVVVSWWQCKSGDGSKGDYVYDTQNTLNGALNLYREYEDGEYSRARAVGIFATHNGLPIGGRMEPARIMQLMHETRSA